MDFSTLRRKSKKFLQLPFFQQCWFIPCLILLGISKVLICTITFRRLAPHLGYAIGTTQMVPILDPRQQRLALQIGRVVQSAAEYTPWNSNCFPQAVTARLLLGLYDVPYALFFGLAHDSDSREMKAHAWITAGNVNVTGGVGFHHFTVVAGFVAPQLAGVCKQ